MGEFSVWQQLYEISVHRAWSPCVGPCPPNTVDLRNLKSISADGLGPGSIAIRLRGNSIEKYAEYESAACGTSSFDSRTLV